MTQYDSRSYEGLEFGRGELVRAMREAYDEIIEFVDTPAFRAFHDEMMSLKPCDRVDLVRRALFNPVERKRRGIEVPGGLLIQTSAFGDRRPTLFVIKKMLPVKFQAVWENVNLTFNNEFREEEVSTSEENAWRPPLPVALQNALLESGLGLDSVPASAGIKFGIYERSSD